MSLKEKLKNYIINNCEVTFSEIETLARESGHKVSYAERELRHIVNEGNIDPIKNNKGHIIGYRAKTAENDTLRADLSNLKPKKVSWVQKLKNEKEIERIKKMPRDENGRIIAC